MLSDLWIRKDDQKFGELIKTYILICTFKKAWKKFTEQNFIVFYEPITVTGVTLVTGDMQIKIHGSFCSRGKETHHKMWRRGHVTTQQRGWPNLRDVVCCSPAWLRIKRHISWFKINPHVIESKPAGTQFLFLEKFKSVNNTFAKCT